MIKLIVEMEMPTGCHDCKLFKINGNCPIPNFKHGLCDKEYTVFRERFDRPSWCPIKGELPEEHGDLIDRKDAIKEFEPYAEYESNRTNAEWVERIKAVLNSMTAVIAAERKDDDSD